MNAYFDPTSVAPNIVEGMNNAQYHARPEYSSSQLKDMIRSSAHFYSHNIIKEHEKEEKKHLCSPKISRIHLAQFLYCSFLLK